jgi:Rod binding domain-containing protein
MDDIKSLDGPSLAASLFVGKAGGLSLPQYLGERDVVELAGRTDKEKMQLAKDFESVFLSRVFDQVRESIGNWGMEEDGASRQIQGLFWSYLAQDVANKGGFGLWQDIYRHFKEIESTNTSGVSFDGKL